MTLIQAVLTSIPIYLFSFFRVPKSVVDKFLRLQRRFLWGGGPDHKKIAWIKWESVCLPKEKGGLGIKDIDTFNLALVGKWKWQLMQEKGELWTRVLESKYGGWRNLDEQGSTGNQSVWWRDLKQAFNQSQQGVVIQNNMRWKVGGGDKIRFWKDKWIHQEETLAERYPRLFLISSRQNHTIRQMGYYKDMGREWNFL